ncbi:MAG: PAS and helix-turn-helix domain-containing protein [Desulfobacteraceae bacterium]|nr:PAS and helix-turn-helix domain-containing protein [Desulfobacteraceae bacterium]
MNNSVYAMHPSPLIFESLEHFFNAFIIETGDGIILASEDMTVVAVNERACDLYGLSCQEIAGRDLRTFFADNSQSTLVRALANLQGYETWAGEVSGVREPEEHFPVDLTIKRLPFGNRVLICFVIRDLTEYVTLKRLLQEEKNSRREMYITMRNLIKAFEKEKHGLESGIAQRIETILLPAIDRLKKEPSAEIRTMYLNILRDQCLDLTKGFRQGLDSRFLSLSATELKVCKSIKQGYSTKEIANELNLAFETVQTHRRNIRRKLKLRGRKVNLFAALSEKSFI